MTETATDLPGPTRAGRPADPPVDRDERRIRAMVDALNRGAGPGGAVEDEAGTAALRALVGPADGAGSTRLQAAPRTATPATKDAVLSACRGPYCPDGRGAGLRWAAAGQPLNTIRTAVQQDGGPALRRAGPAYPPRRQS